MGDKFNKSYIPREGVKRCEDRALKTFKDLNGRNPSRQESERILKVIHQKANELNRDN